MAKRQRRKRHERRREHARRARVSRRLLLSAGLGIGAALAASPSAQAAPNTFTVGTTDDSSGSGDCATPTNTDCSLREAITAADDGDTTDQDHIVFKSILSGNTITLGSNLPYVDEPLYVEGLGAANLTIDGNDHRIFTINSAGPAAFKVAKITLTGAAGLDGPAIDAFDGDANGSTGGPSVAVDNAILTGNHSSGRGGAISASAASLTVENSTISDNAAYASYEGGGGIYARLFTGEILTIQNSTISGNHTSNQNADGGGVRAFFTNLDVQGSTISGNYVEASNAKGGGIYASGFDGGGLTATIQDSTIENNSSYAAGAGIGAYYTELTVEDSTVSGNTTDGDFGFGAGIYAFGAATAVEGSTISDNGASGTYAGGVGLTAFGGDVTIERSTLSGNHADGTHGYGGGIYSSEVDALAISNSTIADNAAGPNGYGGGIRSDDVDPAPVLTNTIVSGNAAGAAGPDISRDSGAPFLAAFSLIENPSGATINDTVPGSNILGVDPLLQPLALNGSLNGTSTHALPPESVAIDCGSSAGATTDQRGLTRPVDLPGRTNSTAPGADGADIGAFELELASTEAGACTNNTPPPSSGSQPAAPAPALPGPAFNLKAAIKKCKKKFPKGPKRKKCIKKAKRRAR
jgi:CSLREA domain-containing protein